MEGGKGEGEGEGEKIYEGWHQSPKCERREKREISGLTLSSINFWINE